MYYYTYNIIIVLAQVFSLTDNGKIKDFNINPVKVTAIRIRVSSSSNPSMQFEFYGCQVGELCLYYENTYYNCDENDI